MVQGFDADRDGRTCPFCEGTGQCAKCAGTGTQVVRKGRLGLKREVYCRACEGMGQCRLCRGTGVPSDEPAEAWPVLT